MRFPVLSVSTFVVFAFSWRTTEAWTPSSLSPFEASTRREGKQQQHPFPQESQTGVLARREFVKHSASLSLGWWALGGGSWTAHAYERRDVGGGDRSPETAAMNEMAYLTNNRLERAGFQLETAAEQSASLTSALSDMSYEGTKSAKASTTTSSSSKKNSNNKKPKQN